MCADPTPTPIGALSRTERLLLDEASPDPSERLLVIDSAALTGAVSAFGHSLAFCDRIEQHEAIPARMRTTPSSTVAADTALVMLPQSLDALDEYATWAVQSGVTRLVLGARIKDLTHSATTVLQRHFRTVRASRGRDKARVLHASDPIDHPADWRPTWPRTRRTTLPDRSVLAVTHHGATFASGRLDSGTALLLGQLPGVLSELAPESRLLDWGSGAGLLATWLCRQAPEAAVEAVDASWAAARATEATAATADAQVTTHWVDGVGWLADQPEHSLDLIVSNPPFHQGVAKDSGPTRAMLGEATRALRVGGSLVVVHNSHLPWPQLLQRHSGRTERLAQDRQFTVTRWTKS